MTSVRQPNKLKGAFVNERDGSDEAGIADHDMIGVILPFDCLGRMRTVEYVAGVARPVEEQIASMQARGNLVETVFRRAPERGPFRQVDGNGMLSPALLVSQ